MSVSNYIMKAPYGFKGELARLIPCIADSHGERRGASIIRRPSV